MAEPTAQSSIEIAAPPELVYRIVSDVESAPKWAEEVHRCKWLGGATGAAVGAKFRGVNEHKGRKWVMGNVVTSADAGNRFAFQVKLLGLSTAQWSYDIEPTDGGCRVTESTRRMLPRTPTMLVNRMLGVRDRDVQNQRNIERTLERLKEYVEKQAVDDA